MHQVSLEEATKTFPALLQKVMKGEEVFILQNQQLVAKIVSVGVGTSLPKKQIKAGSAKGLIKIADDFDAPLEEFKEYME